MCLMIWRREIAKVFWPVLGVMLVLSFFLKVPTAIKVEVYRGSDLWGISEAVGAKGEDWPILWEKNKYLLDAGFENYPMVFADEGDIITLPMEWKAEHVNCCRVEVIEGPHAPFWVWIFKKTMG